MRERVLQMNKVEAAQARVEPQDGHKQRRRGNEGEEEELERSFGAVLAAVHGDENCHRHQREFPETVVEHQVERDEDAEHRRLLHEEERVEDLAALPDRVPACQHADRRKQANENHKPEAQAVNAYVIEDRGIADPLAVDLELEAIRTGDEVRGQMQRKHEAEERGEQRDPVGQLCAIRHKRNQYRSRQRNQQDEREN